MNGDWRGGTWVAHRWRVRGLAAMCVVLMGCLVTDDIDFPEEPDCPPSVHVPSTAEHQLGAVVPVELDGTGGGDAGVGGAPTFEVQVRDCNVSEELEWVVRLNGVGIDGSRLLPTPAASMVRDFQLTVPRQEIQRLPSQGCYRLELRFSGDFNGVGEPEEPDDIGTAVWWLERPAGVGEQPVAASECDVASR